MKKPLWLLISDMMRPDVAYAMASLSWMARESGAGFECYLEAQRDGKLFARTGSTVLGGAHFAALNYLFCTFEVRAILLGETALFDSSLALFGGEITRADSLPELYRVLLPELKIPPETVILAPEGLVETPNGELEIAPYLYPEITNRRALALGANGEENLAFTREIGLNSLHTLFLSQEQNQAVRGEFGDAQILDELRENDTLGTLTLRVAKRWKHKAEGVAFGDPAAILSQIPLHCRENRVAVWGARQTVAPDQIRVSAYTEQTSEIADETAALALEIGNPVIFGRQTGDGDILRWSRDGLCIQITDPNRPVFPIVETIPHVWGAPSGHFLDDEPDDDTLLSYAKEGKVLATLLWHSGEIAHNEAMLNLFELCVLTGVKMGLGAHAARYSSAPQFWEMLGIARSKGGVRGLVEPVLHSGGMGVLAESFCPPDALQNHCETALKQIREIAGPSGTPRGYYAFLDSDLETLTTQNPAIFAAVQNSGLEYFVSSARPGRNRVLWREGEFMALNQSPRVTHGASPFVRITTSEDLSTASSVRPGWLIAALDAPVIAFNPYIWRHGHRFMALVEAIQSRRFVNVLPHTIALYARILEREGFVPPEA